MKNKASWLLLLNSMVVSLSVLAGNPGETDITFIKNRKRSPDLSYQYELRHSASWQNFLSKYGNWYVVYNEYAGKPHRAYGQPIVVTGNTPNERAMNFVQAELSSFGVKAENISLRKHAETNKTAQKYDQVNFTQTYKGLKVETSRITVKMDKLGRVVMWGADVYDNIDISIDPKVSAADAAKKACAGISGVTGTTVSPRLSVLPVPGFKSADHHLVYTVYVNSNEDKIPGRHYTLVDANTGQILYRRNEVMNHRPKNHPVADANMEITGKVSVDNPNVATTKNGFPNLEVVIDGEPYYTDENGKFTFDLTGAGTTNIALSGKWVEVRNQFNGGLVPGANTIAGPGNNTIDLENVATLEERSAYYNTNYIHDFQKAKLNGFDGLDKQLPANVDITPAECNAFYDGQSINFYQSQSDCYSLALVADVIFHEYGHGVNNEFYISLGSNFNNGAMHEGYADVWAFAVYHDPILGDGMNPQNPNDFVRRYDQAPKVYPNDIVGEVHADGEIIAGAWWDTYLNLGNNMDLTMQLFAEAYPGLQAEAVNGDEGTAFTDVLLDALQADDNDADLSNGTPNGAAIAAAFRKHGITLISNAEIIHQAVESIPAQQGAPISAELILENSFDTYLDGMSIYYAINKSGVWMEQPMTTANNKNFNGTIPAMAEGTLIRYYLGVKDNLGNQGVVQPIAANLEDPNIPHFVLVDFDHEATDDFDDNFGVFAEWDEEANDDNATTGMWEFAVPVGTFTSPGDESTAVAPYYQTTPNGNYCFVTQNSASENEGIGTHDVDGGKTTLTLMPTDLRGYTNPTFTYNRWYTNNPPSGANPGTDWWNVQITNDGVNWVPVENTLTSDRTWRRVAFRVRDYVELTNKIQLRFIASDSIRPEQELSGGSLIEAAIDDVKLYDADSYSTGIKDPEKKSFSALRLYPNPASAVVKLELQVVEANTANIRITNLIGAVVYENRKFVDQGKQSVQLSTNELPEGVYLVSLQMGDQITTRKFTVLH